jgi:predicted phage terminase large subunit-like protein
LEPLKRLTADSLFQVTTDPNEMREIIKTLRQLASQATTEEEVRLVTSQIAQITRRYRILTGIGIPDNPLDQAIEIDSNTTKRPHLEMLSHRVASAVRDVERGKNRMMAISMPPRTGKSNLLSQYTPLWILRRHPEWDIVTASYDSSLTGGWARNIRTMIEKNPDLGIALTPDGGAGTQWDTIEGGGMFSTSVRGSMTGRGARVLIIDDPIKDFIESHSTAYRQSLWDWWLSVAFTRLEPPYLVLVVMTRWHEDDFVGRLLNPDYEGDPRDWERISLPAISDGDGDVLHRPAGEPLTSPILKETRVQALDRWDSVRRAVGMYTFSAMYQQRPAPARGAIFDSGWWRFWTRDPDKATEDGKVVYIDPGKMVNGKWCDSWDASFKSGINELGGWVVGQRWVRAGANRYMVAQKRGRWSFTDTIRELQIWARPDDSQRSPWGHLVHDRLIEERANGAAIIDTLKEVISGLKPINPTVSKEARSRAVTPEIESGNVYLPLPTDPGNEWVMDLLSELRNFPNDVADDQVDTLTQALSFLRLTGKGGITIPGAPNPNGGGNSWQVPQDIGRAALTDLSRRRY